MNAVRKRDEVAHFDLWGKPLACVNGYGFQPKMAVNKDPLAERHMICTADHRARADMNLRSIENLTPSPVFYFRRNTTSEKPGCSQLRVRRVCIANGARKSVHFDCLIAAVIRYGKDA